jgi:hypothetical protein
MRRVQPPLDDGSGGMEHLVELRQRLRELSSRHLESLEPFHFQGLESCLRLNDGPVRRQGRPLRELPTSTVALRGFSRIDPAVLGSKVSRDQVKLVSTAALVRSILRNREVDHKNLQLEELIFEYFSRFTTSKDSSSPSWQIGMSGLPAWNLFTTGQVLDLLTKLMPILQSQLFGPSEDPSKPLTAKLDGDHQQWIRDEFERGRPPTPLELTKVVAAIRTLTVEGRTAVRRRRLRQLTTEAQLLQGNEPESEQDSEAIVRRFKQRLHDFCRSIDRNRYFASILFSRTPEGPFSNAHRNELWDAFKRQNEVDCGSCQNLAKTFLQDNWTDSVEWPTSDEVSLLNEEMTRLRDKKHVRPILSRIGEGDDTSQRAITAARLAAWVMIGAFSWGLVRHIDPHLRLVPSASQVGWEIAYDGHGFIGYWVANGIEGMIALIEGRGILADVAKSVTPQQLVIELKNKQAAVAAIALEGLMRQLALQAAGDQDADPYQLGYHLCTVARSHPQVPPELYSQSLTRLFDFFREDGTFARGNPVWTSTFGEFHCFTAELLAHLLMSFRARRRGLMVRELPHMERAVHWLVDHCIEQVDHSQRVTSRQWSMGSRVGSIVSTKHDPRPLSELAEGRSTAITYSFFHLLDRLVSDEINAAVFQRLGSTYPSSLTARLDSFGDESLYGATEIRKSNGERRMLRVSELVRKHLCDGLRNVYTELPRYSLTDWADRRRKVRSVMLFGPPGTGKSTLARSCATYLGWPFLVLDPSVFSSLGLEMVPQRSIEVFKLLAELENVVLLFDEMDELIRERKSEGAHANTDPLKTSYVQRLWTTVFLPRLQELYDQAGTVFFFATNFERSEVDEAVRRPGRFDILMAMPHATVDAKREFLMKALRGALSLECDRLAQAIEGSKTREEQECRVDGGKELMTWEQWLARLTNGDVRAYRDELLRPEVLIVREGDEWKSLIKATGYVNPESRKDTSHCNFSANRFPPSVTRSVHEARQRNSRQS